MGRWADRESDEHRLPQGFERTGYDADSQTYSYRDSAGNAWQGGEGNRYGELHRAGQPRPSASPSDDAALKRANRDSIRIFLPFALLILAVLLLFFRFLNSSPSSSVDGDGADAGQQVVTCGAGAHAVQIQKGDTCWAVAETHGLGVEELLGLEGNEDVECRALRVGQGVCVPGKAE